MFVVLMIPLYAYGRWSPTSVRAGNSTQGTQVYPIASPSQSTLPDGRRNPQSTLPDGRRNSTSPTPLTLFGSQIYASEASTSIVSRAVEANLSWIRYDWLLWSEVEAVQGEPDWEGPAISLFEEEILRLSQNGLTPLVVIRGTPTWAQKIPDRLCGPIKEDALDDFADFMRELVERYSGPPYNVTYWEIWNEPDVASALVGPEALFGCWGDLSDPYYGGGYYAEMLRAIYPAMKEANPDIQVLMGGLNLDCDPTTDKDCQAGKFLEGILQNGGGDYFDIVAYHAYPFWWPSVSRDWDLEHPYWNHRGGVVLGKADFLREVLAQYEVDKPLMLTETSLVCHESICPVYCHETEPNCPPPEFFQSQANYAIRLYTRVWANGLLGASWFELPHNYFWRYSSLLGVNQTPKPAYEAVQFLATLLSGATYTGNLGSESVEGYSFRNDATQMRYRIYWTNDVATTESLPLPDELLAVYDKVGTNITPESSSITVAFEPVIIQMGVQPVECKTTTIQSISNGNWNDPTSWSSNRIPTSNDVVWIQEGHAITVPAQVTVQALCNEGRVESSGNKLELLARDFVINFQTGQIVGQAGRTGSGSECGSRGGSITIKPPEDDQEGNENEADNGVPIINRGQILGGNGGDDEQCTGDGGSVYLFGRHTTNSGTICAGDGGHILGRTQVRDSRTLLSLKKEMEATGGKGGQTTIRGNFSGFGDLINEGMICSGNGGDGNSLDGGDGGDLLLVARPNVELSGGMHIAGKGGRGIGGGSPGKNGDVWIDPETIILKGASVEGGDITISGGEEARLDLSQMNGSVISATESITLAVGTGGVIDLTGNQELILEAKQQILIASEQILLDEGTVLTDIVRAPKVKVMTSTATLPRHMSLIAPQAIVARPAITQAIELTILNNGSLADTYALTVTDSADWSLSALPTPITVAGLGSQGLLLSVTPPLNSSGQRDTITLSVTSQSDLNVRQEAEIDIFVQYETYLPMISR
jgi:hypothetical protein